MGLKFIERLEKDWAEVTAEDVATRAQTLRPANPEREKLIDFLIPEKLRRLYALMEKKVNAVKAFVAQQEAADEATDSKAESKKIRLAVSQALNKVKEEVGIIKQIFWQELELAMGNKFQAGDNIVIRQDWQIVKTQSRLRATPWGGSQGVGGLGASQSFLEQLKTGMAEVTEADLMAAEEDLAESQINAEHEEAIGAPISDEARRLYAYNFKKIGETEQWSEEQLTAVQACEDPRAASELGRMVSPILSQMKERIALTQKIFWQEVQLGLDGEYQPDMSIGIRHNWQIVKIKACADDEDAGDDFEAALRSGLAEALGGLARLPGVRIIGL